MKKRIFSTFLALSLTMSLLQGNALAIDSDESEPEQPACTCEILCTEDGVNNECPVCAADISACAGTGEEPQDAEEKEPAEPVPSAPALLSGPETRAAETIYVSSNGSDTDGDGTQGSPYATLAKAVDSYNTDGQGENVTINVMSNLTAEKSLRFWNLNVTIQSYPEDEKFTITRAENFALTSDLNQGGYNGAMVEVNGSLTLKNIIFDDAGRYEGTIFSQTVPASSEEYQEHNNSKRVQHAIIGTWDSDAVITLDEGTIIKNYGGMSAVRMSGGQLYMKAGSKIYDDITRNVQKGGGTGPAGAVWLQGGKLIMEEGAEICNMTGRAIYADGSGSTVTIYGSIHDIAGNGNMWNGTSGVAMHLRNYSEGTLDGEIYSITGNGNAVYVESHSEYIMNDGSRISNISGVGIQLFGIAGGEIYIDGEITRVNNSAIHMNMDNKDLSKPTDQIIPLHATIGPNGNIHHNTGNAYGTVTAQTYNGRIDVYGKINSNYSSDRAGITLATNMNATTVCLHNGAEICNNVANGTSGVAGAKGTVIMEEGALVSGNISTGTERGSGVYLERDGRFIMKGGQITNNASARGFGGVALKTEEYSVEEIHPYVSLEGGVISGNVMNAQITGEGSDANQYSVVDGTNCDLSIVTGNEYSNISRYLTISDDITIEEPSIYMQKYDFYIKRVNDVKLGNAAAACETAVTTKYGGQDKGYLSDVKGSFWYQSGSNVTLTVTDLKYDTTKPLFAAVVPTNVEGVPSEEDMELWAVAENNHEIKLPLPGSEYGYAVVFVQEENASGIITVVPASLTAYMGGNGGYEAVVDENGDPVGVEESGSLPRPIFLVKGPDNVSLTELTFVKENSAKSWTLTKLGDSNYYRFVPNSGSTDVRVQYSDGNTVVTDDQFEPTQDVYKEYTVTIYLGENEGEVQAKASNQYYTVVTGPGILTVRAVEDSQAVAVKPVQTVPTTPYRGSDVVVAPVDTTYTLNDTGVSLPDDSKPSLLFDSIIDKDVDRTQMLKEKADQFLNGADENRQYEIKYLDLVDANNGNAWIMASGKVTIYWSYPEGTDSDTTFQILHFEDLHRDGTQSGFDPADIETCKVTKVDTAKTTPYGISFEVEPGGFSPFALVWESAEPVNPDPDPNPGGGGTSDSNDYTLHYVTNGGDHLSSETESHSWTKDYEDLPTPVREGYTFLGWYWDLRLTDPVTGDVKVNKTTVSLYAKWDEDDQYDPDDTGVSRWLETDEHNAYLSGYPDNTFGSDKNMTRAEVAQMFYALLMDRDVKITKSFSDVPEDAWYAKAVNTLTSLGMLGGYPDGTFRPDAPITRAEFTAIALAFAYVPSDARCSYSDVAAGDWYYPYVARATTYGWIGGYSDATFRPNHSITRAEVCVIVNNMLGRSADERYVDRYEDELANFADLSKNHWAYYTIMEATNTHNYTRSSDGENWDEVK